MSELIENINEYMQNSEEIIRVLEKEASDASQEAEKAKKEAADYKQKLQEAEQRPMIDKEAAIETAGTLIGRGLISADNLSQTIDRLCADPLGVITQLTKTASQNPIPTMGAGSKKFGTGVFSKEKLSNADKALLSKIGLI